MSSSNELNLIIEEINSYSQLSDIDIEKIVDVETGYAFRIAKFAKNSTFKSNQFRSLIDSINRIERSDKNWAEKRIEFYLLKPKFAMGVSKKIISPEIYEVLISAMNLVDVNEDDDENFKNFRFFVYLFESILAYQKFLEAYDV